MKGEATMSSDDLLALEGLRKALIACGRLAGAALSDDVSTDFLLHVPEEVRLKIDRLQSELTQVAEARDYYADLYAQRCGRVAKLEGELTRAREDLEWFSEQHRLELAYYSPTYGDDDDQETEWRVTKQSGSINDREWEIVGRGQNVAEAIASARAMLPPAKDTGNAG